MSTGGLRPRVVVVWVLLLALLGTIAAVELTDRRRQPAESQARARERMLLPVPVEQLGAIELAHAGTLHRFERDAAGNWFYHGAHTGLEAIHDHQTDLTVSGRIDQSLSALGRARIERQFEIDPRVNDYGVASPKLLILAFLPKETQPVVQYAVGDLAPDRQSRYLQAVGSSTVVLIANYQIENLLGLLQATSTWSASQIPPKPPTPQQP